MPGFCVMSYPAGKNTKLNETAHENSENIDTPISNVSSTPWTNISQGAAKQACKSLGKGYHLLSENEWLTMAENILDNDANNSGSSTNPKFNTATGTVFILQNSLNIYELTGTGEWTNETITKDGNILPVSDTWQEYSAIKDYQGYRIAPPYYLDSSNGLGFIKTGASDDLVRGFIRGTNGIYSLDLSNPPTMASSTVGFRCAR
jgi:hypothetical protein